MADVTVQSFIDTFMTSTSEVSAKTAIKVDDTTTGVTASTTQTQGQGAQTASVVNVTTVANDDDTVTAFAVAAGSKQVFFNNGANRLQIFPASGDDIGNGTNSSIVVAAGGMAVISGTAANTAVSSVSFDGLVVVSISSAYTLGTNDPMELKGAVVYVTSTATLTLPAITTGSQTWCTVIPVGTAVATIDPNASDGIRLNGGTADTDGDSISSSGTAGDMATVLPYDSAAHMVMANGFTAN